MTSDRPSAGARIEASGTRSIAAGVIGTAVTGDVVLPAEALNAARDIEAAPGTGNLPPRGLCLGREDDLAWLRDVLAAGNETAITQMPAVHGLGGIGKTTLALEYAHRHRSDYTFIWWVAADSPARIEQSIAGLALRLFPSWAARASEHEQLQWALNWLQWHPGWLLVFDNVDAPRDLAPYTGALNRGHHLATSRRVTGWPRTTPSRALGTLLPDEAAELLCTYALDSAVPTAIELQEARALAAELGYLPLALEQAGAYLQQNPTISIDAYRRRLVAKLDKAADGIDAERTIARIWTHTLQALTSNNPLAVGILHVLAWLAPDSVPVRLMEVFDNEPDDIAEALGALRAYSMIGFSPDRTSVSIHRLVQAVLRSTETSSPDAQGRRLAEEAVLHALPVPAGAHEELAPEWALLTPHLVSLAATTPPNHQNESVVAAYRIAAEHLYEMGHKASALPLREAIFNHFSTFEGETHPDTILAQCKLATSYESAGSVAEAVSLYEAALGRCEEVFGHHHPTTLITRANLAGSYESAGNMGRAISLYKKVHKQTAQAFGNAAPETLTVRNNLAYAYKVSGNFKRAMRLYEGILSQREASLGIYHPDTLNTRNNLATACQAAGDLERAVPMLESTLAQHEQILGKNHPNTMTVRNNLGHAYVEKQDLRRAIPILEEVLAQREQLLGDIHPDTLQSRNNLGTAYLFSGNLEHGLPLLEIVAAQYKKVLGGTHPVTLNARQNLAAGYQVAGQLERAICVLEAALAESQQVIGPTHAETLALRDSLAQAYHKRNVEMSQ
ncbi:FxSxx-COOH system tetratricopeptide repeat protein [Streptomyces sp. NPDC054783]